jgi:hypothetical protein
MNKYLSSSVDANKLSTTVSGILIGFSTLIISIAGRYGFTVLPEQITELATQAGLAISALTTIYGLLRKVLVRLS